MSHASGIAVVTDQLRSLAREGRCVPEYVPILEQAITHLTFAEEVARQMEHVAVLAPREDLVRMTRARR